MNLKGHQEGLRKTRKKKEKKRKGKTSNLVSRVGKLSFLLSFSIGKGCSRCQVASVAHISLHGQSFWEL